MASLMTELRSLARRWKAHQNALGPAYATDLETVLDRHKPLPSRTDTRPRLTRRQAQVLDFIVQSVAADGRPPTHREICGWMGIRSTNGVQDHIKALERKGYITRDRFTSRGTRVIDPVPDLSWCRAKPAKDPS